MSEESFLSEKLRKFSFLDLLLVQIVYLLIGLLVFSVYSRLGEIQWWFYLIFTIIAAIPIWIHLLSFEGNYLTKAKRYVQTNNPAFQVLLFLSLFFFACLIATWIPVLASITWWYYVIAIIVVAIKPLRSNIYW